MTLRLFTVDRPAVQTLQIHTLCTNIPFYYHVHPEDDVCHNSVVTRGTESGKVGAKRRTPTYLANVTLMRDNTHCFRSNPPPALYPFAYAQRAFRKSSLILACPEQLYFL